MHDLMKIKKIFGQCKSIIELNHALEKFLQNEGITMFTFTAYAAPGSKSPIKYDCASKNIYDWHKYYLSEHFEEVDHDLHNARLSVLPIFWKLKQQVATAKTPREKQLRKESLALKSHVEKGISIPIHGPNGDFSILLLQQCKGDRGLECYEKDELNFLTLGYLYYSFLRKLLMQQSSQGSDTGLTVREKTCLSLAAEGFTAVEVAQMTGITERTVRFHMANINKKLGANNKSQAIYLAQLQGLL